MNTRIPNQAFQAKLDSAPEHDVRMIRTAHYKYNRYRAHGEELYDLVQDPVEIENLAPDSGYLNVKKEMEYKLNQLAPRASVGIRGRGFAVAKNRPPYPGFQRIAILWRVWAAPK